MIYPEPHLCHRVGCDATEQGWGTEEREGGDEDSQHTLCLLPESHMHVRTALEAGESPSRVLSSQLTHARDLPIFLVTACLLGRAQESRRALQKSRVSRELNGEGWLP